MELQRRQDDITRKGLGLAAISYDSPGILKTFAAARGITYLLLSDPGSAIIRRFGLLNTQVAPGQRTYGIPHPGTFILNRRGEVTARFFEEAYQERNTAASILAKVGADSGSATTRATTSHLEAIASASDDLVAPGHRFSLIVDVTPRPRMHVYAPPETKYRAVALRFSPRPDVRVHAIEYPPSEEYVFKPLDEHVRVYQRPFRIVQDVTLLVTAETRALAKTPGAKAIISGVLEYQACDDKVCYAPAEVPIEWQIALKALEGS